MAVPLSPRKLKPRATAALVVSPVAVTDLTCHAVLGLEPRHFREWLLRSNVRHDVAGRRVIALVADCVVAIERAAVTDIARDGAGVEAEEHAEHAAADSLLARLGRHRVTKRTG